MKLTLICCSRDLCISRCAIFVQVLRSIAKNIRSSASKGLTTIGIEKNLCFISYYYTTGTFENQVNKCKQSPHTYMLKYDKKYKNMNTCLDILRNDRIIRTQVCYQPSFSFYLQGCLLATRCTQEGYNSCYVIARHSKS